MNTRKLRILNENVLLAASDLPAVAYASERRFLLPGTSDPRYLGSSMWSMGSREFDQQQAPNLRVCIARPSPAHGSASSSLESRHISGGHPRPPGRDKDLLHNGRPPLILRRSGGFRRRAFGYTQAIGARSSIIRRSKRAPGRRASRIKNFSLAPRVVKKFDLRYLQRRHRGIRHFARRSRNARRVLRGGIAVYPIIGNRFAIRGPKVKLSESPEVGLRLAIISLRSELSRAGTDAQEAKAAPVPPEIGWVDAVAESSPSGLMSVHFHRGPYFVRISRYALDGPAADGVGLKMTPSQRSATIRYPRSASDFFSSVAVGSFLVNMTCG